LFPTAGALNMRNRIINGDMRISQAAGGAGVNPVGQAVFPVDRFEIILYGGSSTAIQSNTVAPTGFNSSFYLNISTGYSAISSAYAQMQQNIEGLNIADLGWGTANAQTITLSFWVRSSLTGQFGGALRNAALNRSYPYTYTINSANTWQKVSITITGETTGTWAADNTIGVTVIWDMGCGSNYQGTAGSWVAADKRGVTGDTSVMAVSGANFYITGVQFEAGSVATPFERRSYGLELSLCQRYYEVIDGWVANPNSSTSIVLNGTYKVSKRAAPTLSLSTSTPTFAIWGGGNFTGSGSTINATYLNSTTGFNINFGGFSGLGGTFVSNTGAMAILAAAEL
jgi:hypothetical protein